MLQQASRAPLRFGRGSLRDGEREAVLRSGTGRRYGRERTPEGIALDTELLRWGEELTCLRWEDKAVFCCSRQTARWIWAKAAVADRFMPDGANVNISDAQSELDVLTSTLQRSDLRLNVKFCVGIDGSH